MQLSYFKAVCSLQVLLFYLFLGRTGIVFRVGINTPYYWGNFILSSLSNNPWFVSFPVYLAGTVTIPSLLWVISTINSNLFMWFFFGIREFPHVHALIYIQMSNWGRMSANLQTPLYGQRLLHYLVLWIINFWDPCTFISWIQRVDQICCFLSLLFLSRKEAG